MSAREINALKATQIIPADGWHAIFECRDGEYRDALVCWALLENGEIEGQCVVGGRIESVRSRNNFDRYEHKSQRTPLKGPELPAEEIAAQNAEAERLVAEAERLLAE